MKRPGRRGAVLLTFATMYAAFGFQLYPGDLSQTGQLAYLYAIMKPQLWQFAWWAAAIIAACSVFAQRDAIGFVALEFLVAVWAGGQYVALILDGNVSAGFFAVLFTALLVLLRIIDGWAEIPKNLLTLERQ